MKKFILQAITDQNHISSINELLKSDDYNKFTISTAFMTEPGLSVLEESLLPVAKYTNIFVGIRNGITTAQSLEKAIEIGCKLYVVDTGTRSRIFHPKLYFGMGKSFAELIIGSANLTLGGLNSNIEASLQQVFALDDEEEAELIKQINDQFGILISDHPKNVILIQNQEQIDNLLLSGRVVDEGNTKPPSTTSISLDRNKDNIERMDLKTSIIRKPNSNKKEKEATSSSTRDTINAKTQPLQLLWTSSPLKERALSIPTAEGTNPTGSMLWNKGEIDIDQQSYFKSKVFHNLDWKPDEKITGKEIAQAHFQIIIKGIDYGCFELTVTNDTRTNTNSYKQKQPMSAIRWGEARPLIAKPDLLGRTLQLYINPTTPEVFIIDID